MQDSPVVKSGAAYRYPVLTQYDNISEARCEGPELSTEVPAHRPAPAEKPCQRPCLVQSMRSTPSVTYLGSQKESTKCAGSDPSCCMATRSDMPANEYLMEARTQFATLRN